MGGKANRQRGKQVVTCRYDADFSVVPAPLCVAAAGPLLSAEGGCAHCASRSGTGGGGGGPDAATEGTTNGASTCAAQRPKLKLSTAGAVRITDQSDHASIRNYRADQHMRISN